MPADGRQLRRLRCVLLRFVGAAASSLRRLGCCDDWKRSSSCLPLLWIGVFLGFVKVCCVGDVPSASFLLS